MDVLEQLEVRGSELLHKLEAMQADSDRQQAEMAAAAREKEALVAENEALERNIAAMVAEMNFLRNRVDELNTQISRLKNAGKLPAVKPVGEADRFVMPRGGADLRRAYIIKEVLSGPISDRECI